MANQIPYATGTAFNNRYILWLRLLSGVEVSVNNTRLERLTAKILIHGEALGDPIESAIPYDTPYRKLDAELGSAIGEITVSNISQIEARILGVLSAMHEQDYEPIDAFVKSEFECGYRGDIDLLKQKLAQIRDRVFDAPFLMASVLPPIQSFLDVYSTAESGIMGTRVGVAMSGKKDELGPEVATSRIKRLLNNAAFKRLLPELLKTDENKFVALFDGRVVDRDANEMKLAERASKKFKPAHLLIRRVFGNEESIRLRMGGPKVHKG